MVGAVYNDPCLSHCIFYSQCTHTGHSWYAEIEVDVKKFWYIRAIPFGIRKGVIPPKSYKAVLGHVLDFLVNARGLAKKKMGGGGLRKNGKG